MTGLQWQRFPVGACKSTFVAELRKQHAALGLILDAWFVRLFSPDHRVV
jgi:hypothetical protein